MPLVLFLWGNLLLLGVNAFGYAPSLTTPDRTVSLYFYFGLFCQMSVLTLLVGALSLPFAAFGRKVFWTCTALVASVAQFVVLLDHTLYGLFQFHINLLVLNVLFNPEGVRSLGIATSEYLVYAGAFAALASLELFTFAALLKRFSGRKFGLATLYLGCQTVAVSALLRVLPIWYDDAVHPDFYAAMLAIPAMDATFMKKPSGDHFGVEFLDSLAMGEETPKGSLLMYPRRPLTRKDAAAPKPDIILLVADSLRSDALTPEVMPHLTTLAAHGVKYNRHFSGGNATRFGIFSLFYGLPGNRWWEFLSQKRPPAMLDLLADSGYEMEFYAGASLRWPEFNDFLLRRIPPAHIHDEYRRYFHVHRDREMVKDAKEFLASRRSSKDRPPYFVFVFFDSTHYPYVFPDGEAVFSPSLSTLFSNKQYLEAHKEELLNRYWNSAHYVDRLIATLLEELPKNDGQENPVGRPDPLVLITGDHGEAFGEHGRWEHASDFTREQIQVPMVLYKQASDPAREVNDITSHAQVAATILETVGVANPFSDYASRGSLLSTGKDAPAMSCGWGECALVKRDFQIEFSTHIESATFGPRWFRGGEHREFDPTESERQESLTDLAGMLKSMADYRR